MSRKPRKLHHRTSIWVDPSGTLAIFKDRLGVIDVMAPDQSCGICRVYGPCLDKRIDLAKRIIAGLIAIDSGRAG